ncbi:MAG TPA: FG-GAP-like repeat-containing protein, partial [Thermoanaerobaculia bacterium]
MAILLASRGQQPAAAATIAGATRGNFLVAPNGSATYHIPIAVPPGTGGLQPSLSLVYNSQQGDGIAGAGWLLDGLPAITRCGATILQDGFQGGIDYTANDRFCLQAAGVTDGRLQPAVLQPAYFTPGTTYRTEKETWSQVVASNAVCGSGPCSFQVTLRNGTVLGFGTSASGQIGAVAAATSAPPPAGSIRTWLLTQMTDLNGNSLSVTYTLTPPTLSGGTIASTGTAYPQRIDYTSRSAAPAMSPMRSVQFFYTQRSDSSSGYQGGAVVQNAALLTAIQTCIATTAATPVTGRGCGDPALQRVKQYNLVYGSNPRTQQSRLTSVQECDGAGGCFPVTTAAWNDGANGLTSAPVPKTGVSGNSGWVADFNGDGRTDLLSLQIPPHCQGYAGLYFANGNGFVLPGQCVTAPLTRYQYQYPGDFNGDGYADLLLANTNGGDIYFSTGSGIGASPTNVDIDLDSQSFIGDVNGDGMADLVTAYAASGSIYLATGSGFASPVPFSGVSIGQGQPWLVDFTGDGRADLFSAGPSSGMLYPSTGSCFANGIPVSNLNLFAGATWVGDFNGDGLPDLFSAAGPTGSMSYANGAGFEAAAPVTGLQLQQGQTWLGDFNGDGMMDLYSAGANQGNLYYAQRGGGFASAGAPSQNLSPHSTWLGDFNGDGAADLYSPSAGGSADNIYFASQNGAVQSANQAPNQVATLTDGIGGQTAITYLPLTNPAVYARQTQPSSGQLDMLLVGNTFRYTPLSSVQAPIYPNLTLQSPLYVVSSYTLQNAAAQNAHQYSYTYNYFYVQSLLNLLGRGWLGFASVTQADPALGATVTTYYRQDFPYDGRSSSRVLCASGGLTPCPAEGGSPLARSSRVYTCQDTQSMAACQVSNSQYDPNGTQLFQVLLNSQQTADTSFGTTLQTAYAYDNYGNLTLTSDLGDVQNKSHPIFRCQTYLNDTQNWRLGYPQYTKTSSTNECLTNISQWNPGSDLDLEQLQYDGDMNVASELHWDNQNSIWLGTQYTYDAYGNQLSDNLLTGATPTPVPGLTFTTTYETTYNTFPQSRTTPTPAPKEKASAPLITTFAYDARFGQRVAMQDPNGNITNTCLDTFGRVSATEGPPTRNVTPDANCLTTATYPYLAAGFTGNTNTVLLSQVVWSQDGATLSHQTQRRNYWNSSISWLKSTAYIDGLQRSYRMVTANDANQRVYVDRFFQTPELVKKISLPYLAGATPSYINLSYDAYGRKVKQLVPYQAPDGNVGTSETRWLYSAPATITTTQVENVGDDYTVRTAFEYYDGKKKTVSMVVPGDGNATSTFSYDLLGSLTGSVSPQGAGGAPGVVNKVQYDSLGRRISYEESNTGQVSFYYNTWGKLGHQVDQKKQRIDFQYDNLLRQTVQAMRDASGALTQRFTYRYDTPAAPGPFDNLRGELSGVTVSDASSPYFGYAFGYDPYQNQTALRVSYPQSEQTFLFTAGYDPMGRQISRHYPDPQRSVVTQTYAAAANDLLEVAYANAGAPEPVPYLRYSSYTPFNMPQELRYQNGDIERLTFDVAGKPLSRTLATAPGTVLSSLVYGWDTLGNLVSTLDCNYQGNSGKPACQALGVSGSSPVDLGQTLSLTSNRLTQASGPFGANQERGTLTFSYDQAGNLTESGGVSYAYSGHQPVSGTSGGAQVFQALYDANGNQCFKALGGTPLKSCPAPSSAPGGVTSYIYSFDVNDRLSAAQRNNVNLESYLYDHLGRRVQKTVYAPDGVTVASTVYYVDPAYEVTAPAGGDPQSTLYLPGLRPRTVALSGSGGGQSASFYSKDLTNSTVMTTGAAGTSTSQVVYQPYGGESSVVPPGSAPERTLFQGKELDSTGMYYFGARYLDPANGRMVSADDVPAGSTYAQDALNRYAFALNNPPLYEDPSGNTPRAIMIIIFQAIFDLIAPETIPVQAEFDFLLIEGATEDAIFHEMGREARTYLPEDYQVGRARDMAREAAERLEREGFGNRAKLTVSITPERIYADVSGAASEGDVLHDADITEEMWNRKLTVENLARAEFGGNSNSFQTWSIKNCAEFRVCNRLVTNREQLTDIQEMYTIDVHSGMKAPRCKNCIRTTWDVYPFAVTSDRKSQNFMNSVYSAQGKMNPAAFQG